MADDPVSHGYSNEEMASRSALWMKNERSSPSERRPSLIRFAIWRRHIVRCRCWDIGIKYRTPEKKPLVREVNKHSGFGWTCQTGVEPFLSKHVIGRDGDYLSCIRAYCHRLRCRPGCRALFSDK
jgi:hypothetical protein